MRNLLRRFFRNDGGNAIVEMAIVITLLLVLVFGIVDIGRVLYTQAALTAAVREAARYDAADVIWPIDTATGRGKFTAAFTPFGSGGTPTITSTITCTGACSSTTATDVTVSVSYPFTWITPIQRLVRATYKSTLTASAKYRWEGAQ